MLELKASPAGRFLAHNFGSPDMHTVALLISVNLFKGHGLLGK